MNHAVLAVGFDASGNWYIRNSWGTGWGQSGFMTLKAGNTCGVLNAAVVAY
jgi:aminopeptidase C